MKSGPCRQGSRRRSSWSLVNLDLDATTPEQIALLAKLANAWIAGDIRNQAIRENAYYEPDIGHATFGAAMRHWKALKAIGPSQPTMTHASA